MISGCQPRVGPFCRCSKAALMQVQQRGMHCQPRGWQEVMAMPDMEACILVQGQECDVLLVSQKGSKSPQRIAIPCPGSGQHRTLATLHVGW